jgi:hypothetical protein
MIHLDQPGPAAAIPPPRSLPAPKSAYFTLITLIRFDPDLEHPRSDVKSLRAFVSLCELIPIGFTRITLIHLDQDSPFAAIPLPPSTSCSQNAPRSTLIYFDPP